MQDEKRRTMGKLKTCVSKLTIKGKMFANKIDKKLLSSKSDILTNIQNKHLHLNSKMDKGLRHFSKQDIHMTDKHTAGAHH
jgi:hypothetical protein